MRMCVCFRCEVSATDSRNKICLLCLLLFLFVSILAGQQNNDLRSALFTSFPLSAILDVTLVVQGTLGIFVIPLTLPSDNLGHDQIEIAVEN